MKKLFVFSSIALFLICIYVFIYSKVIFSVNLNWELKLPLEDSTIYEISTPGNFFGEGDRYHIIQYKNKNKVKDLLNFSWIYEKNEEMERQALDIVNRLSVNEQFIVNFNDDYQYYYSSKDKDTDKLFMFYFKNQNTLFIIEQFG